MSTNKQDQAFGNHFLGEIITWIADNMQPADVFSDGDLKSWALESDFVHIDDEETIRRLAADLGMVEKADE